MQQRECIMLNGLLLLLLVNVIYCSMGWNETEYERTTTVWTGSDGVSEKDDIPTTTVITENTTSATNCLKMQCKFVCFNGNSNELAADIRKVHDLSTVACNIIEELRLYNYHFANNTIPKGFLQDYGNRVKMLYIASSEVTDVEGGAFANGIFKELYFEDLHFVELRKDFFMGISIYFETLTIIQKERNIYMIHADFLDYVKYQIAHLTLQVGLNCVRNVTASDNLLNALVYADFSYNNFGIKFTKTTFNQLSVVEHLDLSHSQIAWLPEYIFSDMASRLEYLDLSNNQLTTISSSIFGWQSISNNLKLMLHENYWHCTCELQTTMREFYNYITLKIIPCSTPLKYHNWSVFDKRICHGDASATTIMASTTTAGPLISHGTESTPCGNCASGATVTSQSIITESSTPRKITLRPATSTMEQLVPTNTYDDMLQMVCSTLSEGSGTNYQNVKKATVDFDVETEAERAYVMVHVENLNDSYGLLWFSNVTKQYYNMEVNYNEYGLGCYGSISYRTTVSNLEPGECYTICVVFKQQMTVSPFNCKSIRTNTNLQTNEWITDDSLEKGIALVVFGIIVFAFMGIVSIYMLLKHKPTLLKGSKRVATSKRNPDEIVVFPKDKTVATLKHKQEMLAKRCSRTTIACGHRRDSGDSTNSYQSYMNANLYEVIPSYLKFNDSTSYTDIHGFEAHSDELPPQPPPLPPTLPPPLPPSLSLPLPISNSSNSMNLVSYAEIPNRTKRTSDDPLPEVPSDQEPFSLHLTENLSSKGTTKINCSTAKQNLDSKV